MPCVDDMNLTLTSTPQKRKRNRKKINDLESDWFFQSWLAEKSMVIASVAVISYAEREINLEAQKRKGNLDWQICWSTIEANDYLGQSIALSKKRKDSYGRDSSFLYFSFFPLYLPLSPCVLSVSLPFIISHLYTTKISRCHSEILFEYSRSFSTALSLSLSCSTQTSEKPSPPTRGWKW